MNTAILRGASYRFRTTTFFSVLHHWQTISAGRRRLRGLSDHALKDIGMTRLDANAEARRWFWDDAPRSRSAYQ